MMPDAELVPIAVEDIEGLKGFALEKGCDLTVVGPEVPLSLGITDVFEASGLKVFGPSKGSCQDRELQGVRQGLHGEKRNSNGRI